MGGELELPGVLLACELQIEVTLQAAAIAFEHGEEQAALLGGDVQARLLLPAFGGAAGDAAVGDAVVLLEWLLQQPEQAVVAGQGELALAGQRGGEGTQVLLLHEGAADHDGFGQLGAEVGQVEGLGVWGAYAQEQQARGFD